CKKDLIHSIQDKTQSMSQTCCSTENQHSHENHGYGNSNAFKTYFPAIISFTLLILGIAMDYFDQPEFFQNQTIRLIWYIMAYIPVGLPVFREAFETMKKGEFFTEFTLMSVATIGAFILGEFPEGVAVMLFYAVGELFQSAAVNRAKNNIKALLDVRPDSANVFRNKEWKTVNPSEVKIGETIQIKVGEKVPL